MSPLKRPSGRRSREINTELQNLKQMLGSITTEEQVATASKFQAGLRHSSKDKNIYMAWEIHLDENCDRGRAWAEIMLHRATGHSSAFYVPEQQEGATVLETGAIDELDICAVGFVRLVAEGRVHHLYGDIDVVHAHDATLAEKLRAYIRAYKSKAGFEYWTYKEVVDLRHDIYQVVHGATIKRKSQSIPTGNILLPYSHFMKPY